MAPLMGNKQFAGDVHALDGDNPDGAVLLLISDEVSGENRDAQAVHHRLFDGSGVIHILHIGKMDAAGLQLIQNKGAAGGLHLRDQERIGAQFLRLHNFLRRQRVPGRDYQNHLVLLERFADIGRILQRFGVLRNQGKIDGILLTMVDSRTNYAKEISGLLRETYGSKVKVFGTDIPHSVRASEISAEGKSIFAHDPKGKVAAAYHDLTKEVLKIERQRQKAQSDLLR